MNLGVAEASNAKPSESQCIYCGKVVSREGIEN